MKLSLTRSLGAAVLAATAGMVVLAPPSHAWTQPYGGCEEATLAPHSAAADACRRHGWTIMRRLAVNPRHLVVGSGLPSCPYEDGGENQPCSWNFPRHHDGNGKGLSYWIDREDRTHYVWVRRPSDPWSWVTRTQDGWISEAVSGGRDWTTCKIKKAHGQYTIRCADGALVRIAA